MLRSAYLAEITAILASTHCAQTAHQRHSRANNAKSTICTQLIKAPFSYFVRLCHFINPSLRTIRIGRKMHRSRRGRDLHDLCDIRKWWTNSSNLCSRFIRLAQMQGTPVTMNQAICVVQCPCYVSHTRRLDLVLYLTESKVYALILLHYRLTGTEVKISNIKHVIRTRSACFAGSKR